MPTTLRPRRQLALMAFGLFLCLCLVSWFGLIGELEVYIGAKPVTVELKGLADADRELVVVTYQTPPSDPDGDEKEFGVVIPTEYASFPDATRTTWRMAGHWIKTIHITAPAAVIEHLDTVELLIGSERFVHKDLSRWARVSRPFTGLLPDRSQRAITIELPVAKDSTLPAINFGAMSGLLQRLALFPVAAFAIAMAAAWLLSRFVKTPFGEQCWTIVTGTATPAANQASRLWFWAGMAFSAAGIGLMYARYSYPFTQEDNFSQFLPVVLYSCRSLFEGHWPAWNPHQFMGSPIATIGIYSVTYPPLYVAYAIARMFGHEYWTIEVYTLLHLAAGYALLYALLRRMAVRPSVAALAGASFVLSGWFLVAGRSQMTFAPLAVWPVAMAWSLHHLASDVRITWRWTALTGLAIGLFFHAGHAQMWVYGMMFYGFGIAVYWIHWRRAVAAIPALLIGIGLAAPLLILQTIEGTSSTRAGAYGDRIDLLHMLLPLGSLLRRPNELGSNESAYFGEMYYSGTLFQALSLFALTLAVVRVVLFHEDARRWLRANVWLVLFGIAILFGLGHQGLLWTAFSQFPVFNRFRWPIKFEYFCLLYSTLAGAVIADRWFTRRPRLQNGVIAAAAGLLVFHVMLCRTSWYDFADRPYPALASSIESRVAKPDGRVLTRWHSMDCSPLPGFYQTLSLDFATQASAYAVGGYDTFVEGSLPPRRARQMFWRDPVAAARAYGVKWIVSHRDFDQPVPSTNQTLWALEAPRVANLLAIHAAQDAGRKVASDGGLSLYELDGADPFAFIDGEGHRALPMQMNSEGATVDTREAHAGETAVVNIAMRPWMKASSNGSGLEAAGDDWGRIRIRLPEPTASITVAYRPPWGLTLLCGAIIVALGVIAAAFSKPQKPEPNDS